MEMKELEFHQITLADKAWMDTLFAQDNRNACEYTFANNFIWRNVYQVEVVQTDGCGVIRFMEGGKYQYSYPIGAGDKKAVIEKLLFLCHKENQSLIMSPLSERDRKELMEWYPGRFFVWGDRDDYDYIYSGEKLTTLAGKKLHGKRNHIARFKDGDDWSYEPMTADNMEECRTMTYTWIRMRSEKWNGEMEQEIAVLHEAFDHREELGLVGGVLRKSGEIVAFTMGEPLNSDTFVVHFEKAYPEMQGAYPMINQQFVAHACQDFTYINREEDTGDLGLRRAKLSYYPEILLKKYVAAESNIVFADPEKNRGEIQEIWQSCFGDEEEYIDFYIKNRMTEETMLLYYLEGKAVSMASFLPAACRRGEENVPSRYVYAVATLPEYRGNGYGAKLLEFAKEHYSEPLLLFPAEEGLISYYEKLGFRRAFEKNAAQTGDIQALELSGGEEEDSYDLSEQITPAEYVKIRQEHFMQEGLVCWDEAAVAYAMEENAYCGGKTLLVFGEKNLKEKFILMYRLEGDCLVVEETTLSGRQLSVLLPRLLEETGAVRYEVKETPGMLWLPEGQAFGEQGYLSLTLG